MPLLYYSSLCPATLSDLSGSGYETDSESEGADTVQLEQALIDDIETEATIQAHSNNNNTSKETHEESKHLYSPDVPTTGPSAVTIVIDESCDNERAVPSLVSLCKQLLNENSSGNQSNDEHLEDKVKLGPALSNIELDNFANCSSRVIDDDGWVSVKSEEVLSEDCDSCEGVDRPPPTFTLAVISRRSRHRAGKLMRMTRYSLCYVLVAVFFSFFAPPISLVFFLIYL